MSEAAIICANSECQIALDGKCVEGLTRETCPNFGRAPEVDEDNGSVPSPAEPTAASLSPSAVLQAEEAAQLLKARSARVVAVIATYDAGKTSLIAGIYDAFQMGPVAGMGFAGSSTLHSFEVACHDSRSASRRDEAAMFRTPIGDARFYHLDVFPIDGGDVLTLLVADRAGEEYLHVAGEISHARPLFEIRRADTVTLLVDGGRLADPKERHNVRAEIEGIVQGLSDAGSFNGAQRLAIALTKHDEVEASPRKDATLADFNRVVASLQKKFGAVFSEIETFLTAASPKQPGARRGEGLPKLLTFWLKPNVVPEAILIEPTGVRDFERLKEVDA